MIDLFSVLLAKVLGGGGSGGTTNYNSLTNKPQINDVELSGNKTSEQLKLLGQYATAPTPSASLVNYLYQNTTDGKMYVCKESTTTAGTYEWVEKKFGSDVDNTSIDLNSDEELEVKDLGISTAKIQDEAVTTAKLDDASVTTAKVVDGNITTAKLATDSVTTVKIVNKNVTTAKIDDDAVTNGQLADNAVQTENIKDKNVTFVKMHDDAVSQSIPATATASTSKLPTEKAVSLLVDDLVSDVTITETDTDNVRKIEFKVEKRDGTSDTKTLDDMILKGRKISDNLDLADDVTSQELTDDLSFVTNADIEKIINERKIEFEDIAVNSDQYVTGFTKNGTAVTFPIWEDVAKKTSYTPAELGLVAVTGATLAGTEKYVRLPNNATTLNISNMANLEILVIPSSVTTITGVATCPKIEKYVFENNTPTPSTLSSGILQINTGTMIYVPNGKANDYKTAWTDYASYIREKYIAPTNTVRIPLVQSAYTTDMEVELTSMKKYELTSPVTADIDFTFVLEDGFVNQFMTYFETGATIGEINFTAPTGKTITGLPTFAINKRYELNFEVNGSYLDCEAKER